MILHVTIGTAVGPIIIGVDIAPRGIRARNVSNRHGWAGLAGYLIGAAPDGSARNDQTNTQSGNHCQLEQ